MRNNQRSIARTAEYRGVGVNCGEVSCITLKPAPAGSGVTFVRTDLGDRVVIPATGDYVGNRPRRTALVREGVEIQMVEHLLAALAGLGIDNLVVEIDGPEVPAADGSALPFVEVILEAGIVEYEQPRRSLVLSEPFAVSDDSGFLAAAPARNGLSISYTLNLPIERFRLQHFDTAISEETFIKEIAPARTFVLENSIEQLRARGLGKGASYENLLVVSEGGVVGNQLRFADEFARHKVLDILGDMFLVGAQLQARLVAVRSGHPLNIKLVEQIRRTMVEKSTGETALRLDIRQIQQILPHRYPFLLVDRVLELVPGERARGIKNVTVNEPFFQGHWPGQPVMPGVLQVEAMAQVAGMLLLERCRRSHQRAMIFAIDKVKLRRQVVPGDQLVIEAEAIRVKGRTCQVFARARVDGQLACEAEMKFILLDND